MFDLNPAKDGRGRATNVTAVADFVAFCCVTSVFDLPSFEGGQASMDTPDTVLPYK